MTGLYKEPFWIITLKVERNSELEKDTIFANVTTRNANYDKEPSEKVVELENLSYKTLVSPDKNNFEIDQSSVNSLNKKEVFEFCEKLQKLNSCYLWHIRLGHVSIDYIRNLLKIYPDIKNLNLKQLNERIRECEICFRAKFNRLPFNHIRQRAEFPLKTINADTMGPITPSTFPHN